MGCSSVFIVEAMQKISFEEDILPLKDKLFRVAYRITLQRDDAEDVVQDTMLKVWSKRSEWDEMDSIEAYCLVVARNLALDRVGEKGFRHDEFTEESVQIQDTQTPDTRLESQEQYRILDGIIAGLPEKQRTVLQLRDIEGKTYKEIADILQLTEEQVKVTLHRTRQRIKLLYNEIEHYGL